MSPARKSQPPRSRFPSIPLLLLICLVCGCKPGSSPDASDPDEPPAARTTTKGRLQETIRQLEEARIEREDLQKALAQAAELRARAEAEILATRDTASRWKALTACAGTATVIALVAGAAIGSAARRHAPSEEEGDAP